MGELSLFFFITQYFLVTAITLFGSALLKTSLTETVLEFVYNGSGEESHSAPNLNFILLIDSYCPGG